MSDCLDVPLDAVPKYVLGVDGAHEKLKNELPVANAEYDVIGGICDNYWSDNLMI